MGGYPTALNKPSNHMASKQKREREVEREEEDEGSRRRRWMELMSGRFYSNQERRDGGRRLNM